MIQPDLWETLAQTDEDFKRRFNAYAAIVSRQMADMIDRAILGLDEDKYLLEFPLIISDHVPEDEIVFMPRPTMRIPLKLEMDPVKPGFRAHIRYDPSPWSEPLVYWADYVSLVDRLGITITPFNWPRYTALILLVVSLIIIMLLVAR